MERDTRPLPLRPDAGKLREALVEEARRVDAPSQELLEAGIARLTQLTGIAASTLRAEIERDAYLRDQEEYEQRPTLPSREVQ